MPPLGKCNLDVKLATKLLSGCVHSLEAQHYLSDNLEHIVAEFQSFFLSVVSITTRLNVAVVKQALPAVWPAPTHSHGVAATQLVAAWQFCRSKTKSYRTGVKLKPAVKQVVAAMLSHQGTVARQPSKGTVDKEGLSKTLWTHLPVKDIVDKESIYKQYDVVPAASPSTPPMLKRSSAVLQLEVFSASARVGVGGC